MRTTCWLNGMVYSLCMLHSSLFSFVLQINYATTGDLRRMHIMSTVAVSKLVGEERIKNNMRLRESLDQIIQRAEGVCDRTDVNCTRCDFRQS